MAWPPQERKRLGIDDSTSLVEKPLGIQKLLERDLTEKVVPFLGEKNVRVRSIASWGRPDLQLIQLAREVQADVIVVGTHQRQGLSRFWLGSVSRAILFHAPTSVAVVPATEPSPPAIEQIPEFNRVLVTTDLSDLENRAIPYAYSALPRGGNVCLIHALVLFNRFYQPDIKLESLKVVPNVLYSTPMAMRLPMRWIAILYERVGCNLAATSGIHRGTDALKMLMAGADVTMLCSALMRRGIDRLRVIEEEMLTWLRDHEYESVEQLKGTDALDLAPAGAKSAWRTTISVEPFFQVSPRLCGRRA